MMQRVAVIRTLLYRPRYLLLDEIFTGLDTVNAEQLAVTLRQYVLDYGASCLIVTHDISRALDIGDSFLYLNTVRKLIQLDNDISEDKLRHLMREDIVSVA